ncbi:MAG: hypothetical protein DRR42_04230 [Gammaproteobacteria bacterium]|nr:MAG: hypothetical protein DRR42_04230 [Gammaproteobacteria bacterium]
MYIAPNFTAKDWFLLRLDENKEDDWQIAVNVIESRLYSRYIEPLDVLLAAEEAIPASKRKYGFTILAIDLLLMETLQAFKEGIDDTSGKSKSIFKNFLKESPRFSPYFPDDSSREKFYKSFRCGILHQAEIQSSTLLWSIGDLYERAGDIEILNRNAVHQSLKLDLDDYILALRDKGNAKLRARFKDKMDALAAH